jgi:hypothetical protein
MKLVIKKPKKEELVFKPSPPKKKDERSPKKVKVVKLVNRPKDNRSA